MGAEEFHISCEFIYDHTVNYAMQQNHVPLVKRLCVTNDSDKDLEQVTIQLKTEPEFSLLWEKNISVLKAGQKIDMGTVDMQLSPAFLGALTERLAARITLAVIHKGIIRFTETSPIDILPYDEWSGTQTLPEIIAAFVYPNHPEVATILSTASKYLEKRTGNPSLNGYQSKDSERVRNQIAAIYAALQEMRIVYCVPPASFEEQGQKIRTPDIINEQHLGTCLDLTVLFAACCEAAGLHPLIVFTKNHAFPGVWLVEKSFSESLQDDVTLLNKRIVSGVDEICVVESTSFTSGVNSSFHEAVKSAENELSNIDQFHFFIDIHRARISQIRPLPLRTMTPYMTDTVLEISTATQNIVPSEEKDHNPLEIIAESTDTRLDHWKRRLLDLSLRNTLLNYRPTKSTISILTAELSDLEDALADGNDFQIHPKPMDWEKDPRDKKIYQKRMYSDPQIQLLKAELSQRRLRTDLSEIELTNRLTQLYRTVRTSIEENGASTFFLALGTLIWYETDSSEKPRLAPLLLIPMEIVRKSVQTGYLIRESDSEPQLNITLIEKLRQDFGININGLNPLPTDDHGIDVLKVLNYVRIAVMNKPRWDVIEEAYLGLFSFSKFVMWNDLKDRTGDLIQNKVVASLMVGNLQWVPEELDINIDSLDRTYHPKDIICPISADSSQLIAVIAADAGKSIVLHGPPGTGKSQTITNIIAHTLGQGKTVLFVAEKMAALSVVQRRLEQLGLAPFCLEVHSNKSKKKDVLDQLYDSLETARLGQPENWEKEANRLAELRMELNGYVQALHCERSLGHSFFQGLSKYAAVREFPHVVIVDDDQIKQITSEKLYCWQNITRQLQIAGEACGHPYNHPWSDSGLTDYLPQLRIKLDECLLKMHNQIKHWQETSIPIAKVLNIGEQSKSYKDLINMMDCAKLFISAPAVTENMVCSNNWDEVYSSVEKWINHGRTRDKLRKEIFSRYSEQALNLDVLGLCDLLKATKQKWFLPRFLGELKITKELRTVIKPGIQLEGNNLENELSQLKALKNEEGILSSASDRARGLLGRLWQDGEADWDFVADACKWTANIRNMATQFSDTDLTKVESLRNHWSKIIAEHHDQLSSDGVLGKQFNAFITAGEETIRIWEILSAQAAIDINAFNDSDSTDWFTTIMERINKWINNLDGLRDWCAWSRIKIEAIDAGLLPLVTAYEQGKIMNNEVETAFTRGFYQAWLEFIISQDKELSSFSRGLFEDKITQFRELDQKFAETSRKEIYARLAARLPNNTGDAAQNSEIGILQREIRKQRGHIALRTLFQRIPHVLTRLKPCLLMSPISVAQYIDASYRPFDLVVFDEASQVPTCDAVGAIARGKEVIVVGDPKQLPPTNFFSAMNAGDDEEDIDLQDMESILDDCLAIQMPEERLKWHYRSRHESLIAFSNYQYYDNKLYTFPSPDDLTPVVKLHSIDGIYDRGKSRQNRAEAEAIVIEVTRRLSDSELKKKSIGIVTFSQAQQRLIEDLLDEHFNQKPELEQSAFLNIIEPLFVKNLETVQGDERDVIIFSIGYGPDTQGRISLNFGPLNQLGGWRRLNVAVSRARQEMLVFSSLRADQIDLSKTNSKGVADLKAFLEYAEHGKQKLYAQLQVSNNAEPESLFEELVSKALEERGHRVHLQVGCSGYRIDMAIVDPNNPGRYLLGIECDGATYHRAKTARDRDKLRESVLRQLGWDIHRIWSTDWWENPQREIERVEKALSAAKTISEIKENSSKKTMPPHSRIANNIFVQLPLEEVSPVTNARVYSAYNLTQISKQQEEFYFESNNSIIFNQILNIINFEGPISHDLLCRRIIYIWGISKVDIRIDARIRNLVALMKIETSNYDTTRYYWPEKIQPENYSFFRTPGNEKRNIGDIPPEEIKNATFEILSNQISLPEDDLIREVAKIFGFRRGKKVDMYIKNGINSLVKTGFAMRDNNDNIVINK